MSIKKTILAFCTLILVTVAVFFLFLHPIDSDGDFYHHLIIGRYVADLRALPYTDTFTYTAAGHPYIGYAWGTGVLFYVIFRTFGAEGISLFVALVGVLTCGLLWVLTREFHLARSVRILLILLAAGVLATRWPTRPEIMTYPGLLAILVVNRIRRHHPQATLLFPVIVFLWANLYSVSLIAGLGILLLIGMFELVNARPKRQTKLLWWNIAAAIGAAWINGYGYRGLFFITLIPRMTEILGDWASIPTILASPVDYLLVAQYRLLIYFLYCCIVLFSLFVSRKVLSKQPIWLLLSTSMLLPFVSFRLVPVAVLLTVPIAGYAWTQVQQKMKTAFFSLIGIVTAAIISIAIVITPHGIGPDESTFPSSLIAFLKTNQLGGRIFNTQRIGAFLSWGLSPDDLTFTDTRDDLFLGTTVLSDLEKTFAADTDVQSLLMKYPADIVVADVAESKSFESLWYSPMWVPVYFSGRYGVFIPPERASALHLAVLSGIDPFSASGAKPKELTTAISTYQRLIDNQPYAIALNILLARSSVAAQQWQNALRILTKLPATTSPSARLQTMDIASLSVWSYLGAQNCAGAKQTLDRLDSLRRKALVFRREVLPSDADKGYAFYFVLCAGNVPKANTYLSRYLRSAGLSLEEKRETVKEFSNLVSSSAGKQ